MKGSNNWPIPETKAECLELALRWGASLSHNDTIMQVAIDNATAIALSVQADAAEVARLSALYPMLPERRIVSGGGEQ